MHISSSGNNTEAQKKKLKNSGHHHTNLTPLLHVSIFISLQLGHLSSAHQNNVSLLHLHTPVSPYPPLPLTLYPSPSHSNEKFSRCASEGGTVPSAIRTERATISLSSVQNLLCYPTPKKKDHRTLVKLGIPDLCICFFCGKATGLLALWRAAGGVGGVVWCGRSSRACADGGCVGNGGRVASLQVGLWWWVCHWCRSCVMVVCVGLAQAYTHTHTHTASSYYCDYFLANQGLLAWCACVMVF